MSNRDAGTKPLNLTSQITVFCLGFSESSIKMTRFRPMFFPDFTSPSDRDLPYFKLMGQNNKDLFYAGNIPWVVLRVFSYG